MGCVGGSPRLRRIATSAAASFLAAWHFSTNSPGNDAIASLDTELFVLTRDKFDTLPEGHKRIAFVLSPSWLTLLSTAHADLPG